MTTAAHVSASELAVLDAILPNRVAFIPDVAIVARLTPSETKEIVTSLAEKHLIEKVDPYYIYRITNQGEFVARRQQRNRPSRTPISEGSDPQELEAGFQDALKKLSG